MPPSVGGAAAGDADLARYGINRRESGDRFVGKQESAAANRAITPPRPFVRHAGLRMRSAMATPLERSIGAAGAGPPPVKRFPLLAPHAGSTAGPAASIYAER